MDPPHGTDPFDFDAAAREFPDRVGSYTLQGNTIRVAWGGKGAQALPVEFEKGKLSAFDGGLDIKADAFPPNHRLAGTFAGGGSTANVSSSRTLTLSANGTYSMTTLGGIRNIPGNAGVAQGTETGAYTLGGNTLALRAANGQTTTHTVLPFNTALDPAKAKLTDEHLIFDSGNLARER